MSLSSDPVAQIGGSRHTAVASLRLGRGSQYVIARLIRFWESRNIRKHGEFMGITMLLLDERNDVIHAFIPAGLANQYRPLLKSGSIVKVDRFEVAQCPHMYKVTEHQFVIWFTPETAIEEVQAGAPVINHHKFMIRQLEHLQILANTNLEIPDVVGQIRSVQGSDLGNDTVTTRIVVRLLIDMNVSVYLSLLDEAASTFRGHLMSGDKSQSVMVVTTVNPKIFGGSLYLNSTPATKFYFDAQLPEINELMSRLGGPSTEVYHCIDTKEGLKRKEIVSIGDLNSFIASSNEQTQEADFLCKARIVEVLQHSGWNFVSCTKCNKKLDKSGTSLKCSKCLTDDVTGVIRFRVELVVDDGKDCATFVVFDKEMSRLTEKEASVLALKEVPNGLEEQLPECLAALAGRQFVFQIRVSPFNFTLHHRTFTVSTMTEDLGSDDESEKDIKASLPNTSVRGDVSTAPSSSTVINQEFPMGGDSGDTPGVDKSERNLKRPRE